MAGANNVNLEQVTRDSVQGVGFPATIPIPLNAFTNGMIAFAAVAAGTVGLSAALATTLIQVIQWEAAATTTDPAQVSTTLPGEFVGLRKTSSGSVNPTCKLYLKVRLRDGTNAGAGTAGAQNAALTLNVAPVFHAVGEATAVASTVATAAVGATDYLVADALGFLWYEFDLIAGLTEAQIESYVKALTTLHLSVYPSTIVGTTLYLECAGAFILIDKRATVPADVIDSIPSA